MGMFDFYKLAGSLACPVDGTPLIEWQGKDGPCVLLTWHEGQRYPTDEWTDKESRQPDAALLDFILPLEFSIRCYDCPRHQPIEAFCRTTYGVWTETRVLEPPGYGEQHAHVMQAGRSGSRCEFVLIDLTSQMPYIPRQARDWPRERLLSWLRVWGEVESVTLRFPHPGEVVYRFHSWAGCATTFTLTDDGRMFIPTTAIEAWVEPPY